MIDPSVPQSHLERRVDFWQHAVAGLLTLGFIAAAWCRLNDCDLFNPDSPRYLIYAQAIAEMGEYRAIDTPGAPLYTWRPPGLPILLAPILKLRPYDVVAAKCVVLFLGAVLLWIVHRMASQRVAWSGPLMLTVVASSPMFLSLSTEVLTEVPYALGILAALYWIGRWNENDDAFARRSYLIALMALAFTPIIRTVGVALVAAVGIWCLTSRRRLRFLPAIAFAMAGLGWLAWRSRQAPASNYAGSLLETLREQGLIAVINNAWLTTSYYLSVFPGVLLPGLTNEQPFYAPMVVGTLPSLRGFEIPVDLAAVLVVLSGVIGMWQLRSRGGMVALLYIPLYTACLAIWPWRHERFLWPLIPIFWAFAPAGMLRISEMFPGTTKRALTGLSVAAVVTLCIGQSLSSFELVNTNQKYLADRDNFLQTEAPGFYFGGWRRAGQWIRDNTPADARILTWQAAVGETAHRFQRRVQFEALSSEKIHQQIAGFSSQYLVVNASHFGLGFPWQLISADPAMQWTIVHQAQNVAVLKIDPNRTGTVSRTAYGEWLAKQRADLEATLARHPDRMDLLLRRADLLQESGQPSQAIQLLEGLMNRGMVTVRVCATLGRLYFEEGRYELAAYMLDRASRLPNAEQVAESLTGEARVARERMVESAEESNRRTVERTASRIRGLVAARYLFLAEQHADRFLEIAPDNAAAHDWRGYLHHLFDETTQAEEHYRKAIQLGSDESRDRLLLLRMSKAIESGSKTIVDGKGATEPIDPEAFATHIRLASLQDAQGWPGRALATLEAARDRFGDQPEILSKLGELNLRFANPAEAAALYRQAQKSWPHEKSIRQGLAVAEAALRVPYFPPFRGR